MDSFLILSILVIPKEKLDILTSAPSSSASCLFLSLQTKRQCPSRLNEGMMRCINLAWTKYDIADV